MRCTPVEVHAHKIYARKIHAHKTHVYQMHARQMHAYVTHAYKMHIYEIQAYQTHAYEGFCEDLARQNTVAHLSQLQLGFRRRRIGVSVLSHIGFSHRRGVLKTTI